MLARANARYIVVGSHPESPGGGACESAVRSQGGVFGLADGAKTDRMCVLPS